ncbi:unnamed protein product, partial [Rangifer tarandus platyrhynchus]
IHVDLTAPKAFLRIFAEKEVFLSGASEPSLAKRELSKMETYSLNPSQPQAEDMDRQA